MSEEKKKTMIEVCTVCSTGKFEGGKCIAYVPARQERLFKAGWCALGSSGNNPPADHSNTKKVRAGQQKQKKK